MIIQITLIALAVAMIFNGLGLVTLLATVKVLSRRIDILEHD